MLIKIRQSLVVLLIFLLCPIPNAHSVGADGTPLGPPNAVTLSGSPTQLSDTSTATTVNWLTLDAGTQDGGSPILGYFVTSYLSTDTSTVVSTCTGSASSNSCTLTGLNFARTYKVRIYATNAIGNSPYTWSSDFNIGSQTQTVTISGNPTPIKFSDPSFQLTATASSGLPVTWSSLTSSICSVDSVGVVSVSSVGTCQIKAFQSGAGSTYGSAFDTANILVNADVNPVATGATSITGSSATLNGSVAYPGANVTPSICLSITDGNSGDCTTPGGTSLGTISPSTITSSSGSTFSAPITGLSGGQVYFYWISVAYNGNTYKSSTSSFTTQNLVPSISYAGMNSVEVNKDFNGVATASGGSGNYDSFAVDGLPDGVTSTLGATTITLAGQPTTVGTYTVVFTVTDSAGQKSDRTETIVVTEKPVVNIGGGSGSGGGSSGSSTGGSSGSVANTKKDQSIYTNSLPNPAVLIDQNLNLAATATSGLPVSYASITNSVCNVDENGKVTFINSGICQINIEQSGNSEFNAVSKSIRFSISLDLKITLEEFQNVQSNSVTVIATTRWPGIDGEVLICISLNRSKLSCDLPTGVTRTPIEPSALTKTSGESFRVNFGGLKPQTNYYVYAILNVATDTASSDFRNLHTSIGPSVAYIGSREFKINEQIRLDFKASGGAGGYKDWTIKGLPSNFGITQQQANLAASGSFATIGVYSISVSVLDKNGIKGSILVPLTVSDELVNRPTSPSNVTSQLISSSLTQVKWDSVSNIANYQVILKGKVVCTTSNNSCTLDGLYGPKSTISVLSIDNNGVQSLPVLATYKAPKTPIQIITANFDLNKSNLKTTDKVALQKLANLILKEGFSNLVVSGHTDSQGSSNLNSALSQARAKTTFLYLQGLLAKTPIAVSLQAKGANEPVASNSTKEGQAINRRSVVYLK